MPHRTVRPARRSARRATLVGVPGLAAGVAALVLLGSPGHARAEAPWSTPTTAFTAKADDELGLVGELDVLQGAGGALLMRQGRGRLRAFGADGTAGRTRTVAGLAGLGSYAGRAVVLRSARRRVTVSVGDLGARDLGTPRVVPGARRADDLVVGARGDLLVVEEATLPEREDVYDPANEGATRVTLHAKARGARTRWTTARLPGRTRLLDVAVDARGTATLLLQRQVGRTTHVIARTLDLRSRRLGPERTLQRRGYEMVYGTVAVDARGGAVLAWGGQDAGEEADDPFVVRGTFRRRGTTAFARTTTLDPGRTASRAWTPPVATLDAAGRATVGWSEPVGESTGFADGPSAPRVSVGTVRDRFGPRVTLLPTGTVVDVASAGATTAVSYSGSPAPFDDESLDDAPAPTVFGVAVRTGAGPLGAPENAGTAALRDHPAPELLGTGTVLRALWDGPARRGLTPLRTSVRATATP